ncbi:MAG: hypothetical protein OSJ27_04925 [Candidatus Gastranaerophilales bacterium]|nr:hypothetical protein [Candidatus Gastranaerophilales bacterium]
MNEEKQEAIYEKLLKISAMLYTLKVALENGEQPNNDTSPYGDVAGIIQHELNKVIEIIM